MKSYLADDDGAIKDMYFAALLMSYGAVLEEIKQLEERRVGFYLDVTPIKDIMISNGAKVVEYRDVDIKTIHMLYTSREVWLPPRYTDVLRSLKSAIHNHIDKKR